MNTKNGDPFMIDRAPCIRIIIIIIIYYRNYFIFVFPKDHTTTNLRLAGDRDGPAADGTIAFGARACAADFLSPCPALIPFHKCRWLANNPLHLLFVQLNPVSLVSDVSADFRHYSGVICTMRVSRRCLNSVLFQIGQARSVKN